MGSDPRHSESLYLGRKPVHYRSSREPDFNDRRPRDPASGLHRRSTNKAEYLKPPLASRLGSGSPGRMCSRLAPTNVSLELRLTLIFRSFFLFEVRVPQGSSARRLLPLIASEQSSKIDIH